MKFPRIILIIALITFISTLAAGAEENLEEKIARLNREIKEKGWLWEAGITGVSDVPREQGHTIRGLIPIPESMKGRMPVYQPSGTLALPTTYDWRNNQGTTPVKNQGSCGSCWAFAATAQMESHTYIYDGRIEDYSEQAVIDCNPWNYGCGGGWAGGAYRVFIYDGAVSEDCIPYTASDGNPCTMDQCEILAYMSNYYSVSNNVAAIKQAIYDDGPVYTSMYAHDNFQNYSSGCYNADYSEPTNHAVLIVGWDDNGCGGNGAWIIKNSWGTSWGNDGYGRIQYGVCGIGSGTYTIDYIPSNVYVQISSPNGGETLETGTDYNIQWSTSRNTPDSISIYLSIDSGVNYTETVATGLSGTSTSYSWNVANLPVETARLKVVAYYDGDIGGYDESDADFTIQGLPRRYVSSTGSNSFPYSLPQWAAHDIQDALDAAHNGDTVLVAEDSYTGSLYSTTSSYIMGGWNSDFTSHDPDLYTTSLGGSNSLVMFSNATGRCGLEGFHLSGGTGTALSDPKTGGYGGGVLCQLVNYAIIKNNSFSSCGYTSVSNYSGGGAIACLYADSVLITGNDITGSEAQCGGAIYLHRSDATITGNRITGSFPNSEYTGEKKGGGIYAYYSELALSGNYIGSNTGYKTGGGIYAHFSPASLSGDTLSLNSCSSSGAGIYCEYGSLTASSCRITGNASSFMGGGIYFKADACDITNSLMAANEAAFLGGGFYADSVSGSISYNTFDRNSTTNNGGNVWVMTPVGLEFSNNIVTYGSVNGAHFNSTDNLTFQYNNCYGNSPEDVSSHEPDSTNISMDPHYADTLGMDYHLALHSSSIDAADPAGGADPDGSRADQGMYGGPDAAMARPDYIQNISAAAANDSTIEISWDELSGDVSSYAVYADTGSGFTPAESFYLGSVAAGSSTYQHYPVDTCWYYRVNAVNSSGYAGGYSAEAAECASGADLIAPAVEVVYPNGGETFSVGDTVDIQWIAADNIGVDSLSISYSPDAGGEYTLISGGEPNDSLYQWTVPATLSDSCLIRITAYDPALNTGADISDSLFVIQQNTGVEEDEDSDSGNMPKPVNHLSQNHPNPFNGTTTIAYSVKERAFVDLKIYDTMGRVVKVLVSGTRPPGTYQVMWNGSNRSGEAVTSGVYFCRMIADKFSQTRKVVYLR